MMRLVVTAKDESRVVETAERVVTVGRGSESTVQIHDEGASRKHCRIEALPDGTCKVSDLGSRNGVRVNGELVQEKPLKAGDVILIGTTRIAVESLSAEAAAAAPAPPAVPAPPAPAAAPKPSSSEVPPGVKLVFIAGPNKGQVHAISHKITGIGRRRRDNEIALFDTGISNRHAEVRYGPEGFVLADVGSRNGTFLNNQRISQSPLRPGDHIQVGRSVIEVQSADSTTAPTAQLRGPAPLELAPPEAAGAAPLPSAPAGVEAVAAAEEPAPSAEVRSRRRVVILAAAIAIAVAFFGGAYALKVMRARRALPPVPSPTEKQAGEGTAPEKGTGGAAEKATTATRVIDPAEAARLKAQQDAAELAARETRQKAEVQAALDAVRRAQLTGEASDFDGAQKALEALRASLKGTAHEQEVVKVLGSLPAARQAAAEARGAAEATTLLDAAKAHRDRNEPRLAALCCRELLDRFPGGPAAAEAKALLKSLHEAPATVPKEK